MEIRHSGKKILTIALSLFLLVGFAGNEKYVELSGYLNARSSGKFRSIDQNVLGVLNKGTRGEILDRKLMKSGNYGYKIEVLNGARKGQKVWVYYNKSNPDLALYDTKPQEWEDIYRAPAAPEAAAGVEAIRETPAIQDPAEKEEAPSAGNGMEEVQDNLKSMVEDSAQSANKILTSMRPAPKPSSCSSCAVESNISQAQIYIASATHISNTISNSCDKLMSNKGELGPDGQILYNALTDPKYRNTFLGAKPKFSNPMGKFCPRFEQLSGGQRIMAWMWYLTSLADVESTCDPRVIHRTHLASGARLNPDEGIGYWAMERYQSVRSENGRGSECAGDMRSVSLQARCTVSIMHKLSLKNGTRSLTTAVRDRNYWGPVKRYTEAYHQRKNPKPLMPRMKRFSLCF